MTLPGKRLRKYHPRRSRKVLSIQKQEFLDCLHTLDLEAGRLIILCKEGSVEQIQKAQAKTRSTYLKFKDQLLELGAKIQETVKERSQTYLNDYYNLVESVLTYDDTIFQNYYNSLLKLKALASLKSKARSQDLSKEIQNRSA
jgi:hypothetical protein